MVEVAHKHNIDFPALRVFVKAAAGANGLGRPSAGVRDPTAIYMMLHILKNYLSTRVYSRIF